MIDLKVEQQVLGCILLCEDGLAEAKKVLTADDFHGENRVIYQAMLEVERKGIALDLVTLLLAEVLQVGCGRQTLDEVPCGLHRAANLDRRQRLGSDLLAFGHGEPGATSRP